MAPLRKMVDVGGLAKLLLFSTVLYQCNGWDTEELELFDLVEEINANFYEVLGVEQAASSSDVRRAYRKLSLQLHPDKNKEEDAEEKFRKLVAVYEVLKDEQKRQRYDQVLENGLPDWRQPVFYYRRVRKMGLLEMAVLLLFIITIGHFLVIWSIYFERRFEMEEVFKSRKRREKKGRKAKQTGGNTDELEDVLQEGLATIPRPRWCDLVPFKLGRLLVNTVLSVPSWCRQGKEWWQTRNVDTAEEEEDDEVEEEVKKPKRRQRIETPDADFRPEMASLDKLAPVVYAVQKQPGDHSPVTEKKMDKTGQSWTDEEINLLAKAVLKCPSGTLQRWEKIAEMTGRTVSEVTKKAREIKSGYAKHVDPASQGTTGSLSEVTKLKKGKGISDTIISQGETFDSNAAIGAKKRPRPTKAVPKTAERTMLITQEGATGSTSNGLGEAVEEVPGLLSSGDGQTKALKVDNAELEDEKLVWTQNQQKILEWALAQYPRGTAERWEKVAEHIPGKTKEDCIARFKYLAEIVKKRKQATSQDSTPS